MKWALTYLLLLTSCFLQKHDHFIRIAKHAGHIAATKQIPNNRLTGEGDHQLPDLLLSGTCEEEDESKPVKKRSPSPAPFSMLNKVFALTVPGPLQKVRQSTISHYYSSTEKYIFEKSLLV